MMARHSTLHPLRDALFVTLVTALLVAASGCATFGGGSASSGGRGYDVPRNPSAFETSNDRGYDEPSVRSATEYDVGQRPRADHRQHVAFHLPEAATRGGEGATPVGDVASPAEMPGTSEARPEAATTNGSPPPSSVGRSGRSRAESASVSRPVSEPAPGQLPAYARGAYFGLSFGAAFGSGSLTLNPSYSTSSSRGLDVSYGKGLTMGVTVGADFAIWKSLTLGFAVGLSPTFQMLFPSSVTVEPTRDLSMFDVLGHAQIVPAYTLAGHHRFSLGLGFNLSGYLASYTDTSSSSFGDDYDRKHWNGVGFSFSLGYTYRRRGPDPFLRLSKHTNGPTGPLLLEVGVQL